MPANTLLLRTATPCGYCSLLLLNEPPTLHNKKITALVLRHTAAMDLLHAGVDSVIALWLGHENIETTQIYQYADLALKEQALARTKLPSCPAGRYRLPDDILAWLEAL